MKKILQLLLLLPFTIAAQCKINKELSQKQHYCGGAKPPPEILAQYDKPLPYANKKLIIVSSKNKVDSTITSSDGFLRVKLKPGSYKLYEPWRYHQRTPDASDFKNYDKACLSEQWKKADITIEAQKKKQEIIVNLDDVYCPHTIPCLTNPHFPE